MGLGYWTSEHLVYDTKSGELLTDRPWTYYVPQARDIPQNFNVYLRKNSYSLTAVLGSKGKFSSFTLVFSCNDWHNNNIGFVIS